MYWVVEVASVLGLACRSLRQRGCLSAISGAVPIPQRHASDGLSLLLRCATASRTHRRCRGGARVLVVSSP